MVFAGAARQRLAEASDNVPILPAEGNTSALDVATEYKTSVVDKNNSFHDHDGLWWRGEPTLAKDVHDNSSTKAESKAIVKSRMLIVHICALRSIASRHGGLAALLLAQ